MKGALLVSSFFAAEAVNVKFKTYVTPGCTGTFTEQNWAVAAATGGACYDLTSYSTKNQYCDEASQQFRQEFYSGSKDCSGTPVQQAYPLEKCSLGIGGAEDPTYGVVVATCDFSPAPAPCFGRDTMTTLADGSTVPMSELTAGDYVLPGPTRIIVNQHKNALHLSSPLLKLEHGQGSISLTPDHVLNVDGSFVAAREAIVGSKLGKSEISRITSAIGGIINPLTTSGKIMADGVLASTYPEWIAGYMLGQSTASASSFLSFLFPATTQAYYDAFLEQFFQSTSPTLVHLKAVFPAPLVALTFIVADIFVAAGFVAFSLCSLKSLVALLAIGFVLKSRK